MSSDLRPFHLAIPVDDLAAASAFYGELIGCARGRSSETWIDYDFFGHQLVVHLSPEDCARAHTNTVDGEAVPARHFGVVLTRADWEALAERLRAAGQTFLIEPQTRFKGEPGEQGTFFLYDPAGNALEFKYFDDLGQLFAH
ncbi:MAG: VOC family protein [Pseudomonadota bacterium]